MPKKLDEIRTKLGLPPLSPGIKECLMCEKPFYSWDIKSNRRCPACQQKLDNGYNENQIEVDELYWDDIDTVSIELDDDYIEFIHDHSDFLDKL